MDRKTSNSIEKYINKTYNGDSTEVRVFDGYSYEYDKQNRISAIKQLDVLGKGKIKKKKCFKLC